MLILNKNLHIYIYKVEADNKLELFYPLSELRITLNSKFSSRYESRKGFCPAH